DHAEASHNFDSPSSGRIADDPLGVPDSYPRVGRYELSWKSRPAFGSNSFMYVTRRHAVKSLLASATLESLVSASKAQEARRTVSLQAPGENRMPANYVGFSYETMQL